MAGHRLVAIILASILFTALDPSAEVAWADPLELTTSATVSREVMVWRRFRNAGALTDLTLRAASGAPGAVQVLGDDGIVVESDNGGWVLRPGLIQTTQTQIEDMWMAASGQDGWAVGTRGTLLRLKGGRWKKFPTPSEVDLHGVAMVASGQEGWAVGDLGTILRWDGRAWTVVEQGRSDLHDVWVDGEGERGWIVGDAGVTHELRGPSSEGRHWVSVRQAMGSQLRAIDVDADGRFGVAVGDGIVVLKGGQWVHREIPPGLLPERFVFEGSEARKVAGRGEPPLRAVRVVPGAHRAWAVGFLGAVVEVGPIYEIKGPPADDAVLHDLHAVAHDAEGKTWAFGERGIVLQLGEKLTVDRRPGGPPARVGFALLAATPTGDKGWAFGRDSIGAPYAAVLEDDVWTTRRIIAPAELGAWVDADARAGWAVGTGGLLELANGKWRRTSFDRPLSALWIDDTGRRGWALGKEPLWLDSGRWGKAPFPAPLAEAITMGRTGEAGWAFGAATGFQRFANVGGWRRSGSLTAVTGMHPHGLWVDANAEVGWGVTADGSILALSNGRWNLERRGGPKAPRLGALDCADATQGWAVGTQIMRLDEGRWFPWQSPDLAGKILRDVRLARDGRSAWAAGEGGLIAAGRVVEIGTPVMRGEISNRVLQDDFEVDVPDDALFELVIWSEDRSYPHVLRPGQDFIDIPPSAGDRMRTSRVGRATLEALIEPGESIRVRVQLRHASSPGMTPLVSQTAPVYAFRRPILHYVGVVLIVLLGLWAVSILVVLLRPRVAVLILTNPALQLVGAFTLVTTTVRVLLAVVPGLRARAFARSREALLERPEIARWQHGEFILLPVLSGARTLAGPTALMEHSPRVTLLRGPRGSGKTSLLEQIASVNLKKHRNTVLVSAAALHSEPQVSNAIQRQLGIATTTRRLLGLLRAGDFFLLFDDVEDPLVVERFCQVSDLPVVIALRGSDYPDDKNVFTIGPLSLESLEPILDVSAREVAARNAELRSFVGFPAGAWILASALDAEARTTETVTTVLARLADALEATVIERIAWEFLQRGEKDVVVVDKEASAIEKAVDEHVLTRRSTGVGFTHPDVLEYFVARHLDSRERRQLGAWVLSVPDSVSEERWDGVFFHWTRLKRTDALRLAFLLDVAATDPAALRRILERGAVDSTSELSRVASLVADRPDTVVSLRARWSSEGVGLDPVFIDALFSFVVDENALPSTLEDLRLVSSSTNLESAHRSLEQGLRASLERNRTKRITLRHISTGTIPLYPDVEWTFQPGVNVLLGRNGYGKSHLLRMIAAMLTRDGEALQSYFVDEGGTTTDASIELWLGRDHEDLHVVRKQDTFLADEVGRVPVLAIPDARAVNKSRTTISAPHDDTSFPHDAARHFIHDEPYESIIQVFLYELCIRHVSSAHSATDVGSPFTRLIHRAVDELADSRFEIVRIETAGQARFRILVRTEGQPRLLPLQRASQGTLSVVAIVGIIYSYLEALEPGRKDEVEKRPGIVLIDEVDAHLHPVWQRRIVTLLRSLFPRVQFILTAHSPLVVAGCLEGEVSVLRRGSGPQGFELTKFEGDFMGWEPARIYRTVFDLETWDRSYERFRAMVPRRSEVEAELSALNLAHESESDPALAARIELDVERVEEQLRYIDRATEIQEAEVERDLMKAMETVAGRSRTEEG